MDVGILGDVVVHFPGQLVRNFVLVSELFKDFQVFTLLDVLGADVGDQTAHAVDVIGQHDAADSF